MNIVDRMRFRLRALFSARDLEHDIDREMQFHVDMEAERLAKDGASPSEARRLAHVAFGGRQRFREEAREEARGHLLEQLAQDLRHAVRTFHRTPTFTLTVVATLAIGIGATTVIFSVTDNVVLRALPYANADRMVTIEMVSDRLKNVTPTWPPNAAHFLAWKEACTNCERLGAIRPTESTLTSDADPVVLKGLRISDDVFPMLGAHAEVGRLIGAGDDTPDNHVVVISDALWRQQFGARGDVVGRTMSLDNVAWTIVGVVSPTFQMLGGTAFGSFLPMPKRADYFVPLALQPYQRTTPGEHSYGVFALLKRGVTAAALRSELGTITAANAARLQDNPPALLAIKPLQSAVVGSAGRPLVLLLAAVGAVLLIMCVNLANVFLARSAARRRESAVRIALGAARTRLMRQALTETVALALVGGIVGIVLSQWGVRALIAAAPAELPRLSEIRVDGRVLAVSLIVSAIAGLAFGFGPAIHFGRTSPGEVLKETTRGASDGRRSTRLRSTLIASQVGLSALLLVLAGLFLKSFVRVLSADRGFSATRVLAVTVALPRSFNSTALGNQFYEEAMRQTSTIPGVSEVAVSNGVPLEGETWVESVWTQASDGTRAPDFDSNFRFISPTYFKALGVPILSGRGFVEGDRGGHRVVLSENAARALWPGERPLGKFARLGGPDTSLYEVIGVAANVRTTGIEHEGSLTVYTPYWERGYAPTLLVRTTIDPASIATAVRAALRSLAPTVAIAKVRTVDEVVSAVVAQRRFEVVLIGLFAITALVTASIGIYGVIAHSLSRRAGEISVRIALGAAPHNVYAMVFGEMLRPVALGLGGGLLASLAVGRAVASLLFEVRPTDIPTLLSVAIVIGAVAALACWAPSRRATRLDPVDALRAG